MHISSRFDSGNIDVVRAEDPADVRLRIRPDPGPDGFFQWFHFRISGVRGEALCLRIENAGEASYPKGWEGYSACVSADREVWTRAETGFADGVLTIRHTPETDSLYVAYFAPYSRERHRDLIAACQTRPGCRHVVLGETLDGEEMDLLSIGDGDPAKKRVWTIARQHPGESMAEWFMEGMLTRLLDASDPVSRAILERATVYAIPNMNPDGSRRGHLRTNAKGVNLNREWDKATMENSPEVFLTLQAMERAGLDFCLDVHGDEGLPYNFIAGADAIPSATAAQIDLRQRYEAALRAASPDFQSEKGYPKAPPGKANLSMAATQIAERFGALSMTLEMPFKDNANAPDPVYGWSVERCRHLGRAHLDALLAVLDDL
jgi:murein tripeptide amidase MpaA